MKDTDLDQGFSYMKMLGRFHEKEKKKKKEEEEKRGSLQKASWSGVLLYSVLFVFNPFILFFLPRSTSHVSIFSSFDYWTLMLSKHKQALESELVS